MHRRILFLITDLEVGGTPSVVRELARRLHSPPAVSIDVASLAPDGPVSQEIRSLGISVHTLGATTARHFPRTVSRLVHLIRDRHIDTVMSFLIHANTTAATAAAFCSNVHFIQSIQTTQPNPRWHWRLQGIIHHAATHIAVPSPSVAQAASVWSDIPKEKIVVIPNAIDPSDCPTELSIQNPESPHRVVFIGRLDPVKRIPDLLLAIEQLHGLARLDIYGTGAELPRIENEIARLKLESLVTLHGAIPNPRPALAKADVLVLPSVAEGFGLVLIEAMASGVPVVATDVPGIRDVVRHEKTGLLVPPNSPGDIARAIERLIDQPQFRRQMASDAFADVHRRFTWPIVLPQYRRLLDLS